VNKYLGLLIFLSLGLLRLQGQGTTDAQRYRAKSGEIFFHSADSEQANRFALPARAGIENAVGGLHDLVQISIETALKDNPTSDSIESMLRNLQGEVSLNSIYPEWSNIPFADVANINGTQVLASAFAVLSGGIGIPEIRPYVQFYSKASGTWMLVAEVGTEFAGTAFSMNAVRSAVPGELWYLVWGRAIGDTGARLKMSLYALDGRQTRTVWQRENIRGGTVEVSHDEITLDYFEPMADGIAPPRHLRETLRPGQTGLETFKTEYLDQ